MFSRFAACCVLALQAAALRRTPALLTCAQCFIARSPATHPLAEHASTGKADSVDTAAARR